MKPSIQRVTLGGVEYKLKLPLPTCPKCGKPMKLCLTPPSRAWAKDKPVFWGCSDFPTCKASHGAHRDGRPLGIPADDATKAERIRTHDIVDRLWKGPHAPWTRTQVYAFIREALNLTAEEAHIGRFTLLQCAMLRFKVAQLPFHLMNAHEHLEATIDKMEQTHLALKQKMGIK